MTSKGQSRNASVIAALVFLVAAIAHSQEKPQPQVTVDLKALGASPDLFTEQGDSKYPQRGTIDLFWLDDERVAVAFSTGPRWTDSAKPIPLRILMLIFDRNGKQQSKREWNLGAEGSEGQTTVELAPGPDKSVLAVHESNSAGKIPEGDFIQVLNPDASLRQNFYVPATGAWLQSVQSRAALVVETYYADNHSSLAWWSGHPLKLDTTLDLPPQREDSEETLVGPGVAARVDCPTIHLCSGVRIFGPGKTAWMYHPPLDTVPVPLVFLNSSALLLELRDPESNKSQLLVAHQNGAANLLPPLPHGMRVAQVTSVAADGQRVALTTVGESGICGVFDLWCRQRSKALAVDVLSGGVIVEQEVSPNGGISALSPDGRRFAIFERNRLTLYSLP